MGGIGGGGLGPNYVDDPYMNNPSMVTPFRPPFITGGQGFHLIRSICIIPFRAHCIRIRICMAFSYYF